MHHLNMFIASCLLYFHVYITFNDQSCPNFCIVVNYTSVFVTGCMHITETTPLFCYWIFFPLSQMCWPANDMLFGCFIAIEGWEILCGELLWKGVKRRHDNLLGILRKAEPELVKLCRGDDLMLMWLSDEQDECIGRGVGSAAEADGSCAQVVWGQVIG